MSMITKLYESDDVPTEGFIYYGFVAKLIDPFGGDGPFCTPAFDEPAEPKRIIIEAMDNAESMGYTGIFAGVVGIPADEPDLSASLANAIQINQLEVLASVLGIDLNDTGFSA